MIEDLLISGFGVIGTEVLYQIVKKNKKNKLKTKNKQLCELEETFQIAVIEQTE